MEIERICPACRGTAAVYMKDKDTWYVACECAKTKEWDVRDEAIAAWNAGEIIPAYGPAEGAASGSSN